MLMKTLRSMSPAFQPTLRIYSTHA